MFKHIKPLQKTEENNPMIFLAGSIEMGEAEMWQEKAAKGFINEDVTILNPRRDDWDSTWKSQIKNKQFRDQVEWELSGLENSVIVLFYFDINTKSPISLLELGLFHKKAIVCCPKGFWKKGNVDIVCKHYNIKQVNTLEQLIKAGKKELKCL